MPKSILCIGTPTRITYVRDGQVVTVRVRASGKSQASCPLATSAGNGLNAGAETLAPGSAGASGWKARTYQIRRAGQCGKGSGVPHEAGESPASETARIDERAVGEDRRQHGQLPDLGNEVPRGASPLNRKAPRRQGANEGCEGLTPLPPAGAGDRLAGSAACGWKARAFLGDATRGHIDALCSSLRVQARGVRRRGHA